MLLFSIVFFFPTINDPGPRFPYLLSASNFFHFPPTHIVAGTNAGPNLHVGAACSLHFLEKQAHAASSGGRSAYADRVPRPFCGWGLLHLGPGDEQPFERNADSHLLYRVLLGSVAVKYGSGFVRPLTTVAEPGDMFVIHPYNFFGLRNLSESRWVVLLCMNATHGPDAYSVPIEASSEGDDAGLPTKRRKYRH